MNYIDTVLVGLRITLPDGSQPFHAFLTDKLHPDHYDTPPVTAKEIQSKGREKCNYYTDVANKECLEKYPQAQEYLIQWVTGFQDELSFTKFIENNEVDKLNTMANQPN